MGLPTRTAGGSASSPAGVAASRSDPSLSIVPSGAAPHVATAAAASTLAARMQSMSLTGGGDGGAAGAASPSANPNDRYAHHYIVRRSVYERVAGWADVHLTSVFVLLFFSSKYGMLTCC